jgi:hypothetical protein
VCTGSLRVPPSSSKNSNSSRAVSCCSRFSGVLSTIMAATVLPLRCSSVSISNHPCEVCCGKHEPKFLAGAQGSILDWFTVDTKVKVYVHPNHQRRWIVSLDESPADFPLSPEQFHAVGGCKDTFSDPTVATKASDGVVAVGIPNQDSQGQRNHDKIAEAQHRGIRRCQGYPRHCDRQRE